MRRVKAHVGHMVKIESKSIHSINCARRCSKTPDVILLDNMSPAQLAEAVRIVDGRAITEASGGVSIEKVAAIAASGVDLIAIGWLTHSAPTLDIGLDFPD